MNRAHRKVKGEDMFKKVLVANRGEIAARIITACQEMGIKTIGVFSRVDRRSPYLKLADEAYSLGEPEPQQSYLNIEKIISIAIDKGADAVHPGYGFLAENPRFAKACTDAGLTFIGPNAKVIEAMGDKIHSKETISAAGVPVIPGYSGQHDTPEVLLEEASKIGFPLMIKAAAGGGGKGIRILFNSRDFTDSLESVKREAKTAFGDDRVLLEKYITSPRHIEFQVLADNDGKVIHLFERECSIQRRHQKIIEECPSVALTPKLREEMGNAAITVAKTIGYTNAGTVEFILAPGGVFYFLEMNTRLQVEHPITEETTGIDLAKWQLRIASGEPLTLKQEEITQRGHAIECRIYAEDPTSGFLPSIGHVHNLHLPTGPHIRHEVGIEAGQDVSTYYDPMLSKLIVWAENRHEAIERMRWALANYTVLGVTTNIEFMRDVLDHRAFREGRISTHFIDDYLRNWKPIRSHVPIEALIAASIFDTFAAEQTQTKAVGTENGNGDTDPHSPWSRGGKWRLDSTICTDDRQVNK